MPKMPMSPFPGSPGPPPGMRARRAPVPQEDPRQFESLRASLLFCPKCQTATPARERLLLVLPTGNLYEYLCAHCGTSTGSKTDQTQGEVRLFAP
jgi:hypothetical protein